MKNNNNNYNTSGYIWYMHTYIIIYSYVTWPIDKYRVFICIYEWLPISIDAVY